MSDDRTYDALMEHVRDCADQRRKVDERLASLERKMDRMQERITWGQWLIPMVSSLGSALIVASAIWLSR